MLIEILIFFKVHSKNIRRGMRFIRNRRKKNKKKKKKNKNKEVKNPLTEY